MIWEMEWNELSSPFAHHPTVIPPHSIAPGKPAHPIVLPPEVFTDFEAILAEGIEKGLAEVLASH